MNKEVFVNTINAIKQQQEKDAEKCSLLAKVFPNCYEANLLYDNSLIINALIELLREEINDTDYRTAEELYDYLTQKK